MTLYGPDVSNNNWGSQSACVAFMDALPGEGFSWVEAKVSEGNYYQDPYWAPTLAACRALGIPCIGYHYVTTNDPTSQAATFVGNGGGAVVMLDFEANSGDINNFWAVVTAFNAAGVQVALSYIPHWYWQEIGSPDLTGVPGLIASDYVSGSGYASALYPGDTSGYWFSYGNATPAILQFTDAAVIDGISVDANAFVGTADQLAQLLGATPTTPPPTPPTPGGTVSDLTLAQQQDIYNMTLLSYQQLCGAIPNVEQYLLPGSPTPVPPGGWEQLGQNQAGLDLTMIDAIADIKDQVFGTFAAAAVADTKAEAPGVIHPDAPADAGQHYLGKTRPKDK